MDVGSLLHLHAILWPPGQSLRLLPALAMVAVPNAVTYPSGFLGLRKGLSSHHPPDLQGRWVLSWGRFVLTGEFCLSPALSIHQLAAQGELSQLKEHLRKGSCLSPWVLTPDCSTPFNNPFSLVLQPFVGFLGEQGTDRVLPFLFMMYRPHVCR